MFEKKEWKKGDQILADDLNRIELGITDNDSVIERIKSLPKLENGAKAAEITKAYNALIDAANGVISADQTGKPDDSVEPINKPDKQSGE